MSPFQKDAPKHFVLNLIFKKRPEDPEDELKEKLYKIRPFRLITKEDLE